MKYIGIYQQATLLQTNKNNCGVTCVCMMLRYAGIDDLSNDLESKINTYTMELSLLDLKRLFGTFDIAAKCVSMDIDYLNSLGKPVILHCRDKNGFGHFQVCFSAVKINGNYYYLMGDPASGFRVIDVKTLAYEWRTNAALYLPELKLPGNQKGKNHWYNFIHSNVFSGAIWLCIPILHTMAVFMSISLSFVIQKILSAQDTMTVFAACTAILLFIFIALLRAKAMQYRQHLLVKFGRNINFKMMKSLKKDSGITSASGTLKEMSVRAGVNKISKFQIGVSNFLTVVLSDLMVILILSTVIMLINPWAGIISIFCNIFAIMFFANRLPVIFICSIYLNGLYSNAEKALLINKIPSGSVLRESENGKFERLYQDYLVKTAKVAGLLSKYSFRTDLIGIANIATTSCLLIYQDAVLSSNAVIILLVSYFMNVFIQRVNNGMLLVYEGVLHTRSIKV